LLRHDNGTSDFLVIKRARLRGWHGVAVQHAPRRIREILGLLSPHLLLMLGCVSLFSDLARNRNHNEHDEHDERY
jgi:hypothetical protein